MGTVAQSISWWPFVPGKLKPPAFVKAVAKAGYAAIDLVPPEHFQLVKDSGLEISSSAGQASIPVGFNRREHHARLEREVRANLDRAAEFGVANLVCFSGNRSGQDDSAGIEQCAESLRRLAPAAEAAGVTLLMELLNSKVDHADYQADHTAWAAQLVQRVNSPRVKVLYDIYHMQIMEGDLIRTIQTYKKAIGHYHTAGNPGRHELDQDQEINYPAVLAAIVKSGFKGYVAHEFIPTGEPVAAIKGAFDYCAPYL